MSDPGEQSPNYFCHNCGTTNTNGNICSQCRSEFLEEVPTLERISDDQQIPLIRQFQNLFNNGFDMQSFTNMLLPMLMVQTQADVSPHRHRRARPPRRIKRVTHRYLPFLDFLPIHNPVSQVLPGQVLSSPLQTNMTLVQVPLQLFIFDQNGENINQEMLTQLFNDDMSTLPVTRDDINQLSTLTSELYEFY
jgi:hypothetical protein